MSAADPPLNGQRAQTGRLPRWSVLVLILAILAGLAVPGWWVWQSRVRRQALEQARAGRFEVAAPTLLRVLASSPNDVDVLRALARGYAEADDKAAARPFLDRWCRLRPDDAEPFQLRIELLREQQPDLALADGLHLLERTPDDVALRFRVAGLAFAAGQFAQAEKECRTYLERKTGEPSAVRLLAQAVRAQGRHDEAATLLDELLRKHPDDPAALMGRAILHLDNRQPTLAVPMLEKVVNLDPRRQRTGRYQLALAYEQAGRKDDARRVREELRKLQEAEVLQDALRSQPGDPDVQLRAARAYLAGGNLPAAFDVLGQVLERRPDDREAHLLLADYYDQVGQPQRAAEARRRAGAPAPDTRP